MLGYKVAQSEHEKVIVTLEIPEDAITNMNRQDVVDVSKAKHRTNKAKVISIEDLKGNTYNKAESYKYNKKSLIYEVGKTVFVDDFDTNIDNLCSTGIHYFLDKELAKMYDYSWFITHTVLNGPNKSYSDNGRLWRYAEYKDRALHGKYIRYHYNGQVSEECTHVDGKKEGVCIIYHYNGQVSEYCNYVNGKKEGICIKYDCDGNIIEESTYKNGKLDGISKNYYELPNIGKVYMQQTFRDGMYYGYHTVFDMNGNIIRQYTYTMDSKGVMSVEYTNGITVNAY